jgi:diguanylate cyclase (GGDEF)-like protein
MRHALTLTSEPMHFPDVDTLRLCSILASSAFGFVFAVLWLRNRAALHFAIWASSSLLYGGGMVIFGLVPSGSLAMMSIAFGVLALTNVLPLAGVLALEGQRIVRPWMALPILSAAFGHALPSVLALASSSDPPPIWQTIGDASGLMIGIGIPGLVLAFGKGAATSAGRRMAGVAMLCYVPAYMLSIAGEFLILPSAQLVPLLAMLSDQVLLGVLNLGLLAIPVELVQRQLRDAALRDALTGCWNRGGLAKLEPAFHQPGVAVLALDVDRFKQINDCHGHAAGDGVLAFIGSEARDLATGVRGQVVRLGGDEFIILIPGGSKEPASFAELLQERLAAGSVLASVWSVSIGIATRRASDTSLAETIARADGALYQAKHRRRKSPPRRAAGAPIFALATHNRAAASSASR